MIDLISVDNRNMKLIVVLTFLAFVDGEPSECTKVSMNAAFQDRNTIVDTSLKTLAGTWLSEGCETRPGPEYVLRHYSFGEDGRCKLIQHHYWDDSCSSPKLTIVSIGHLKTRRDSFLHHAALGGSVKPINISVIPQDFKAAKELDSLVASHCPEQNWKSWRRYEEHLVYTSAKSPNHRPPFFNPHFERLPSENHPDRNTQHNLHNTSGDISCLGPLRWTFNEMALIKIQLRPNSDLTTKGEMHWELLLGDLPSRLNRRGRYTPTGFQVPLVKISKGEVARFRDKEFFVRYSCNICPNLLANERIPPHLLEKPRLPPFISGEWVSGRCEIRPLGLFLSRKFSFFNTDLIWVGEHRFYSDPFCTFPKFVVTAAGDFRIGDSNKFLSEASDIDFKIDRATLVVFDRGMVEALDGGACGEDPWRIGVPQELSLSNGCRQLGIVIPSVQYDVVKVEMNYQGSWLLFLGQADEDNLPRAVGERPTAFQLPLVKCGDGHIIIDGFSEGFGNQGSRIKLFVAPILTMFLILRFCS